jgi:hypothetical protein
MGIQICIQNCFSFSGNKVMDVKSEVKQSDWWLKIAVSSFANGDCLKGECLKGESLKGECLKDFQCSP